MQVRLEEYAARLPSRSEKGNEAFSVIDPSLTASQLDSTERAQLYRLLLDRLGDVALADAATRERAASR